MADGKFTECHELIEAELTKLEKGSEIVVGHDLKYFSQNVLPDVPLWKQLVGKGQIRNLDHTPNMEVLGIEKLIEKTPRQIEEDYSNVVNIQKIIKQINKSFEGRELGKGQ